MNWIEQIWDTHELDSIHEQIWDTHELDSIHGVRLD